MCGLQLPEFWELHTFKVNKHCNSTERICHGMTGQQMPQSTIAT